MAFLKVTTLYGLKAFAYGGQGVLRLVEREEGEVYDVALPDGCHDLTNYNSLLTAFDAELSGCIVNNRAVGERRLVDQRALDFGDTAAVPTYTPSDAVRFERAVQDVASRFLREERAKDEQRRQRAEAVRFAPGTVEADEPAAVVPDVQPVDPVLTSQRDVDRARPLTADDMPQATGASDEAV